MTQLTRRAVLSVAAALAVAPAVGHVEGGAEDAGSRLAPINRSPTL